MYDKKKKYPTLHIYLSKDLRDELLSYVRLKYGNHKAISLTIQQAVKDFLRRQNTISDNDPLSIEVDRGTMIFYPPKKPGSLSKENSK